MTTKKPSNNFNEVELRVIDELKKGRLLTTDDMNNLGMDRLHLISNFLVKCHRNGILLFEDSVHGKVIYGMAEKHKVLNVKDEYIGF